MNAFIIIAAFIIGSISGAALERADQNSRRRAAMPDRLRAAAQTKQPDKSGAGGARDAG